MEVNPILGTIVRIIDKYTIVINKGLVDGVKEGQRYLIYKLEEEEIKDPGTGESLGQLEIVKGTGKVSHVQERLSTIESDQREPAQKRIVKRNPMGLLYLMGEEEVITSPGDIEPFNNAEVGDKAKPI